MSFNHQGEERRPSKFTVLCGFCKVGTSMSTISELLATIFKSGMLYALTGAAAAVVMTGIGSILGIRNTAQVSAGVMSEEPRYFGKYLILVALPGTQGIYGFVAAFLVIMKLQFTNAEAAAKIAASITTTQGLNILSACLPIAIAGLVSAIHQGKVCTAGVELTAKQPAESGKALVLGVFVEFYAVLGLIVTIFMLTGIQL